MQYTSIYHAMELNRLKIVLVEKKRTEATISRWCTNESQPSIETLFEIAKVLDIDVKDLLVNSKEQ